MLGLDREAAKKAFAAFLTGRTLTGAQIEFINLIVDHLTERGAVGAEQLYSSPFTDVAPHGPDGLFKPREVDDLISILENVRARAEA